MTASAVRPSRDQKGPRVNSFRQSLLLNPDEIHAVSPATRHDGISFLRASPGTEGE